MKKILTTVFLLAIIAPRLTFAHLHEFNQFEQEYNIGTRVEVSKDGGSSWASFDSSDATGLGEGQTLVVSPGDILIFKVRVWNEGYDNALNVVGVGTRENFTFLSDISGVFDNPDEDGDSTDITGGGVDTINIDILASGGSASSGYQSATFTGKVKSDIPDGTVVKVHYEITSADFPEILNFSPSVFWAFLIPVVHADDDGTAVTEARAIANNPHVVSEQNPPAPVQELPQAGTGVYGLYLALGLIISFYAGRVARRKVESL